MRGFSEKFTVKIPEGKFYYPSCGRDTYWPIKLFGELVDEMHFSDVNGVILPYVENGISLEGKNEISKYEVEKRKKIGVMFNKEITHAEKIVHGVYNHSVGEDFNKYFNKNLGDIRYHTNFVTEIWKTLSNHEVKIITHKFDGILTLLKLKNLSVFFYRNNENGESRCNQLWFHEELLDIVLDKLVDGALIVADGSGSLNGFPWMNAKKSRYKEKYRYKDIDFTYLGAINDNYKSCQVWQVKKKF